MLKPHDNISAKAPRWAAGEKVTAELRRKTMRNSRACVHKMVCKSMASLVRLHFVAEMERGEA